METTVDKKRILWVDDEIDSLKPHILFLQQRGFDVHTVMSGDDAIAIVDKEEFDLVLLDEMMPGKDGLTTLEEIKDAKPHLPVVMVTKSEEEALMDQAIGKKIADYLVKPVNPSQIVLVIKRILDARRIISDSSMQRYITEINRFNQRLYGAMGPNDWYDAARILAEWNLELDENRDVGLEETLEGTRKEWNVEFTKYIMSRYPGWLRSDDRPTLSPDVARQYVLPPAKAKQKLAYIVIDCMRLDQWLLIEPLIAEFFTVKRDYYFSLLPTATPFCRNALFAGIFPDEINRIYPENYRELDEGSLNRNEEKFFEDFLARNGLRLGRGMKYLKINTNSEGEAVAKRMSDFADAQVLGIVFNFLDILSHGRSSNVILKEIAGTESAFRSLMKSWFVHSPLFTMLKWFAEKQYAVVLTSDHGSVLCKRGTMAHGKRTTSTNLRYKYGDNLNSDPKESVLIKKPDEWRLPTLTLATTYIIAKEDFYFVYPNNYNEMVRQFQNSFQHGGISIEEMIVPVSTLTPR